MLFYSQIKREFTQASWTRGQLYFRGERVKNVGLNGQRVMAKIQGTSEDAYDTAIEMARGTIFKSECSCPAHKQYETHCKHVAALAIWIVERGSLLRSGVAAGKFGVANKSALSQKTVITESGDTEIVLGRPQQAAEDRRLRKLLQAYPVLMITRFTIRRDLTAGLILGKDLEGNPLSIPITKEEANALLEYAGTEAEETKPQHQLTPGEVVLYVRGLFQSKALTALIVESAIRYREPGTGALQVHTVNYLQQQSEPGVWKTNQGLMLRVPLLSEIPEDQLTFIHRIEKNKIVYQGQAALENLAIFLSHKHRDQMVFDKAVDIYVEPLPLKLAKLHLGKKVEKSRELAYEFTGGAGDTVFSSEELQRLAGLGKLSNHYVWREDRIFRFEQPLSRLQAYANRTGVAASEGGPRRTVDVEVAAEPGALAGAPSPDDKAEVKVSAFTHLYDGDDHPLHPIAAFRLSLEMGAENFEVDPDWVEFHEWKKNFDKVKLPKLPTLDYGFELREYQTNGLSWMWGLYHRGLAALLADEMGLGKTHQVLAFLSSLYCGKKPLTKTPSLVVAPTSVIAAWAQKLNRYDTGLKWKVFHGAGRKLPASGVHVVLTTYGILHREAALREKEWHTVILDEAQAIKNATTISSRAARVLKANFRVAMTGTPVENQATDLWSLMEFLLPGYLGTLPRFKRLYSSGRDSTSDFQARALKRLIAPFLLRRTKAQVLKELPEKTEEIVLCEMTEVQRRTYAACLASQEAKKARESLKEGGKIDYANILALLTRLKQICDHPRLAEMAAGKVKKVTGVKTDDSGKWESMEELVNQALESNLKVVIFTQYLGVMDLIGNWLEEKGVGHTELRGDTTDRGARIEKFANDENCKVFVCSLLAGGLGIDLTSASVCIHFDRWWNPAKENQATDRLHRFGQTRGVQVFKLQIPGTVEDRIASIIDSKTQLSGALIEESSLGIKAFSRKELLELLAPVE